MNKRELATVLAALRNWQVDERNGVPLSSLFSEHFADDTPLDATEIDALCEKLNQ